MRRIRPYIVVGFMICREPFVIQLPPSSHNLVVGPTHRHSWCPWHKKFLAKNGVSSGPMCLQSRQMRDGQLVPHVTLMHEYQHIIPTTVFDMPL